MNPRHLLRPGLLGLLLASLAGCVAPDVDPAGDYERASSLVAERSGAAPAWKAPWADDTTSWDGSTPLTVQQAVTLALQNNRGLRSDLEGIAGAKADLAQSGLLPNPVLSASLFATKFGDVTAVGLVQELTQLWLRPEQKDAAGFALRAQVETVSDHALRLVADVRNAHSRVVFGQKRVALTQAHLELIQRAIDVAQRRVDAGEGVQLDVNRLRADQLSTQADLSSAQLDLQTSRRDLLALLGRAGASAEWQAAEDPRLADASLASLTESDAVARATRLRLDVQAARSVYEQRHHELSVATRGKVPDIALGLDYGEDQDNLYSRGADVSIELPVFDTKEVGVASAESALRSAAADADQVLQAAVNQTRSAFLTLQTNLQLASFYREQVLSLAHQNLDAAQQSYEAGEADLTVVLDTQREVSDDEIKLNDLQLAVATSVAELEYVVGGKL